MQWILDTGGIMIYPLLFCSVLALAIILEKTGVLLFKRIEPRRLAFLRNAPAGTVNLKENSPLRQILYGEGDEAVLSLSEREERVSLRGEVFLQHLRMRLPLLSLIGRISPMLGLTGTVLGLTDTFKKVAGAQGMPDISLLAGGIWEAMLTTIAGLIIGIAAIVAHHLIDSHIDRYGFELRLLCETFLVRESAY